MPDRIPTTAELTSLEHDEREAVILSAVDQRLADLARMKASARAAGGRRPDQLRRCDDRLARLDPETRRPRG